MITIGGRKAKTVELRVPFSGCWEVFASFADKPISGRVDIDWRGWTITGGEVDPARSGPFAGLPFAVVVGGFAWTSIQLPKSYQDDRGILASTVLQPLASSIGQTLTLGTNPSLGRYFMRRNESGGALMARIYGIGKWYVGTDGITRTGTRETFAAGKSVSVLNYDPREQRVELYADRPDQCLPGATIAETSRHPALVITDLIVCSDKKERITAYVRAA